MVVVVVVLAADGGAAGKPMSKEEACRNAVHRGLVLPVELRDLVSEAELKLFLKGPARAPAAPYKPPEKIPTHAKPKFGVAT